MMFSCPHERRPVRPGDRALGRRLIAFARSASSEDHGVRGLAGRLHQWFGSTLGRRVTKAAIAIAIVLGTLAVADQTGDLRAALHIMIMKAPSAWWLVAAVSAEAVMYLAFAAAQRQLLSGSLTRLRYRQLVTVGVASQGIASFVPGTNAVAAVLMYRLLRRVGSSKHHAAKLVAVTTLLFSAALFLLALLGASVVGGATKISGLRLAALATLFALLVVAIVIAWRSRAARRVGDNPFTRRLSHWLSRTLAGGARCGQTPTVAGRETWPAATALFATSWIADAVCLAFSFYVLHVGPPWLGLPLAYLVGQLASLLPFTPGGLGVVEGGLAVALTAFGTHAPTSLAVVLVYRLISFWALLPVSAIAYFALHRHYPRLPRDAIQPDNSLDLPAG